MKKLIFKNFIVFICLISVIITGSSITIDIYKYFKSINPNKSFEQHTLPNYINQPWAEKHFIEYYNLGLTYYDYIIWKRDDFKGETITIKNGYRLNNSEEDFKLEKDIWVFGGSTIWGTGTRDYETIPALIEKKTGTSTLNLGETGYTSSQQLNLLIKNMIKHNPKIIIFYDGVNEVFSKCKKENNYFSALREKRIQDLLKKNETNFQIILKPTFKIINFLKRKILRKDTSNNQEKEFDCDINIRKSEDIAKTLVSNWEIVKSISQQNGIKFIPILQPTAFSTKSLTNHLSLNEELKSQYEKVYFQIKKEF